MKVLLLCIGKTSEAYLRQGIDGYKERLKHYTSFEISELKDVKPTDNVQKRMDLEATAFLSSIQPDDFLVLLDENGKSFRSVDFAEFLGKHQVSSTRRVVFAIGGAYGWGEAIKKRADLLLSFSAMTFSHQMIRLFFTEQLYRAFTILKGEKYHNP